MGRSLCPTSADVVYHVLNRANARRRLFDDDGDYAAFERVLTSACARVSMRLLAYCAMPNHWHLVVWPRHDGDLSRFMNWLTLTHT
jgi:putative transposase